MIADQGVPEDNITYARSVESEGVDVEKEVVILTGPPFVHHTQGGGEENPSTTTQIWKENQTKYYETTWHQVR